MNTYVLSRLSILSISIALCLPWLHQATGQQEAETPAEQVIPPTDSNGTETPSDETADSAMDEPEPPNPAEEAFQRASEHEKNNELDKAIEDCTEALQSDPKNLEYLTTRAELYGEMRNHEKALEDAAKILEADPKNLRARLVRAKMFEFSGNLDKALTELNTAVEQNPTSWQALFQRQGHFERRGEHEKALADGDRMIQLDPGIAAGYLSRGLSHAIVGESDQAMNYANALIQAHPENPLAYVTRAAARGQNGDYNGAKEDLEAAIDLAPDNAFALNMRGELYFRTGDYEKSLADYQKAAELQPRNYGFKASLAEFLATCPDDHLRDAATASQLANDALKLAPNDPDVWRACAAAAAESGNFEEAIKWQQRVVNSPAIPANVKHGNELLLEGYQAEKPYRNNLALLQQELAKIRQASEAIKSNNFDRAIALLSEVIAANGNKALAYPLRGFAFYKKNDYAPAITDFSRALEFNPKDAEGYFYRARSFEKTKQYAKALDDLLTTYKLNPELGNGMDNDLAWFFATCPDDQIRNAAKAAEHVDRALELKPNDGAIWDTCAAVFAENRDFEEAVEWEKAYLDRNDVTQENRRGGEKRLALYQAHKPFRNEPEDNSQQLTVSTTPGQPGK